MRPSVLKVNALKQVGDYKNETGHFEMDYAKRYVGKGYKSAFLDTICSYHTGKCTWEKGDNSYSLNCVQQFKKDDRQEKEQQQIQEDDIWLIVKDKDSFGNDICYIGDSEIEVLKTAALSDPNCIGFNSLGYLKSKIEISDKWITVSYTNFYMFVNKERYLKQNDP